MVERSKQELFRRRKGSPYHWFRVAEDLKAIGDAVPDSYLHVRLLLVGYSFENLFKALIIANLGPEADPTSVNKALSGHNQHYLRKMAKAAGVTPTEDETAALEQLEEFVRWVGRYPVPNKAEGLAGLIGKTDGPGPMATRYTLWERLAAKLNEIGWIKADWGDRSGPPMDAVPPWRQCPECGTTAPVPPTQ